MKRRHYYLHYVLPIVIGVFFIASAILLWDQNKRFEAAFLHSELEALNDNLKTIVQVCQPLLEENDLDRLEEFCESVPDGAKVTVLDRRGAMITATTGNDLYAGQLQKTEVQDAFRHGYGNALRRDLEHKDWRIYAAKRVIIRNKPLVIHLSVPKHRVSSALRANIYIIYLVLLTGAVTVGFFFFYMTRAVVWPLERLYQTASQIASEDYNAQFDVPKHGPVRKLTKVVQSMADRLNKEITASHQREERRRDFIANVSHEIKTPLTGINSAVEILAEGGWNQPEYLDKCRGILRLQVGRLNHLVRGILNLGAIERIQEGEEDFLPILLHQPIQNALRLCEMEANEKGIALESDLSEKVCILGKGPLIEQAVTNLVLNACHYSGGKRITVSLKSADKNAFLTVEDDGIGIPPEEMDRIFDRFYRIKGNTHRSGNGFGLGLPIVRQIAQVHHGSVEVDPNYQSGARFVMVFPLYDGSSESISDDSDPLDF